MQSACRHRRRGLIVAPQSRLERRDSRCRSAKAPKELKCSALEPPAICDEAGADAPRLTLRDIGPLLLSLVVQGGAQPHLTIRILGNGVNVVQSSDYPDIDERVQRAIIAVSRLPPLPQWTPFCVRHLHDLVTGSDLGLAARGKETPTVRCVCAAIARLSGSASEI